MENDTIFGKIVRQEVATELLYQDELVSAFRDISPQAPVHILIVPNKPIATVDDVEPEDEPALGRLFTVAKKLAAEQGLGKGYRLIMNCKEHAHQEVFHLHLHLLGGRPLGPLLCPGDE